MEWGFEHAEVVVITEWMDSHQQQGTFSGRKSTEESVANLKVA